MAVTTVGLDRGDVPDEAGRRGQAARVLPEGPAGRGLGADREAQRAGATGSRRRRSPGWALAVVMTLVPAPRRRTDHLHGLGPGRGLSRGGRPGGLRRSSRIIARIGLGGTAMRKARGRSCSAQRSPVAVGLAIMGCGKAPGRGRRGPGVRRRGLPAGTEFGYPVSGRALVTTSRALLELADAFRPGVEEAAAWSVDQVVVDGTRVRDFLVYQDGREVDRHGDQGRGRARSRSGSRPGTPGRRGPSTEMTVDLVEPSSGDIRVVTVKGGQHPGERGYWDPAWKELPALVVSEEHGFERTGYPGPRHAGHPGRLPSGRPTRSGSYRAERNGADVVYERSRARSTTSSPGTTPRS
ncbi:MAG: hypothetical protein MZW92_03260 [Comamonadaceae bacterium]|nr:hypothetical protein [Comamonadaceae bacterium]